MLMEPESKKVIETVEQKMKREKRLLKKVEKKNVSNCFFSVKASKGVASKTFASNSRSKKSVLPLDANKN